MASIASVEKYGISLTLSRFFFLLSLVFSNLVIEVWFSLYLSQLGKLDIPGTLGGYISSVLENCVHFLFQILYFWTILHSLLLVIQCQIFLCIVQMSDLSDICIQSRNLQIFSIFSILFYLCALVGYFLFICLLVRLFFYDIYLMNSNFLFLNLQLILYTSNTILKKSSFSSIFSIISSIFLTYYSSFKHSKCILSKRM